MCALACVCLGGDKAMAGTKEPAGTEPLDAADETFGSANIGQSKPEVPPQVNTPSQRAFH